jgi:hypothetical protein
MNIIIGFSCAKSAWKIGSDIIKSVEKRPFSHVYIRTTDCDGMDMIYQASEGMVNCITYDGFKTANIPIKEYKLSGTQQQYNDIIYFLKTNLGVSYSYSQIAAISIKKLFHVEIDLHNGTQEEICSELGSRVAKLDGINVGNDLDFTTPSDLDEILTKNNIQRIL